MILFGATWVVLGISLFYLLNWWVAKEVSVELEKQLDFKLNLPLFTKMLNQFTHN
jgi:hypothetical protein